MSPTLIGLIVFLFTFVGALFGAWVRASLPRHHVEADSKDTIKVDIGLIATMTALVLGLVTASSKSSFGAVDDAVKQTATEVLVLDRTLARYGPETKDIRNHLHQAVSARVDAIWPEGAVRPISLDPMRSGAATTSEGLADAIRQLQPKDNAQRALQARAADLSEALLQARWLVLSSAETRVPGPFLIIMTFWLTVTFMSFGLFAPRNATVVAALFLSSLSVACALFLVLEMGTPFEGVLKASDEPLRQGLAHMNQ
jgi:Protein of unknown function (DUF4239)